jgi:hypothetical protein
VQYGHTFPWWNASVYTPRLFDLDADPLELTDLAAAHPDMVASLTATMETEMGGPGSIDRVDAAQMTENLALYKTFFQDVYNKSALLDLFLTSRLLQQL